jgi:hypothetical protein
MQYYDGGVRLQRVLPSEGGLKQNDVSGRAETTICILRLLRYFWYFGLEQSNTSKTAINYARSDCVSFSRLLPAGGREVATDPGTSRLRRLDQPYAVRQDRSALHEFLRIIARNMPFIARVIIKSAVLISGSRRALRFCIIWTMQRRPVLYSILFASLCCGQQAPNLPAQREAMKKLAFLVGKWSGGATTSRGPNETVKVKQTEDVQFKLGGLLLLIEGTGRNPDNAEVMFNALATISYDEAAKAYRFRAYNDGRYLDTDLKVPENGFEWGYKAGPADVRFVMRLNDKGEWVETGDVKFGDNPPQRTFEMTLRKQN